MQDLFAQLTESDHVQALQPATSSEYLDEIFNSATAVFTELRFAEVFANSRPELGAVFEILTDWNYS